jgi:hypothetical protein
METSLDMLKNSTISEEDSRLVDSILNELNSNEKEPQHLTQPPQRPPQMQQPPQQQMQQPSQQQMQQGPQQQMQQPPQQQMQQGPQQQFQQGQQMQQQILQGQQQPPQQQPQQTQQQTQPNNGKIPPPPNLTQDQFNNLPSEKKQVYLNHKQQYMLQNRPTIVGNIGDISILDDLKNKSTLLLLVFVLLIMIQSSPMNYILALSPETFFSEVGECNLSGVVIKSFIVCNIYYIVTKYLF